MPTLTAHPDRTPDAAGDARRLFGAVLEGWAADVLRLRARGLDRPSRREGAAGRVMRPRGAGQIGWTTDGAAPVRPRWAA